MNTVDHANYGRSRLGICPCLLTLGLILGSVMLNGCSIGGKPVVLTVIEPQLASTEMVEGQAVDWALEVKRPLADQMRDSDRVVVRRVNSQLQLYPGLVWIDAAPDLYQSLLIESLRESQKFTGVGRSGNLRAPFSLVTELRRFDVVDDGQGERVEIIIAAMIIDQRTGKARGHHTFRHQAAIAGRGATGVVQAFEESLEESIASTIEWLIDIGSLQTATD